MDVIKKVLGVLLSVLVVLLILNQLQAYRGPAHLMNVSATGKVTTVPDMATVSIGVIAQANTAEEARVASSNSMNSILHFLQGLKIDPKDIQTTNFTTTPRYQYQDGKSTIIGYDANQTVNVTLRKIDQSQSQLQTVLSQVTQAGANSIQGVQFRLSTEDNFKKEATQQAIKNARVLAEQLAESSGLKLVKLVNIIPTQTDLPIMPMAYSMAAKSNAVISNVEPGSQEISSTITLVYEVR